MQHRGLKLVAVENEAPLVPGGSELATMMKQSAVHLAENYLATGEVTSQDIDAYCQFASNPKAWAIYHGMVSVVAQKSI